ncbi:MFS transporter, CP family, cyanate transporter [Sinosporangium album]|uniref:MFS transporter, CP family, cyanate transporter n=1 Tax=Sinosporangium album TaxID=504805 RepID=A0A1G8JP51_9ACTN|nr:MFS transporter [Sinosporangium album]SDI32998.1 MFS transporter, CP family, cyanate transporter [Sinosporangium album]
MTAVAHTPSGTRKGSPAWLVVVGIVLAALNLRTAVTSIGPVLDRIGTELHMSGATLGLLTTLPVLCFAVFGVFTPAVSRRVGQHTLFLAAILAMGTGLLIRAVADSAWLFLGASTLALAGSAIGNVLVPALVKQHFLHRAGPMMTVYSTALAVGTMIAAAFTVPIQDLGGGNWRLGIGIWATLAAIAAVPWFAMLRDDRDRRGNGEAVAIGALVRNPLAWAVAVYFGTQSLIAYALFGWLPQILIDGGYSSGQSGLMLAVFTGLGIPVALIVPPLASRLLHQRGLVAACGALYLIGFPGLWLAPDAAWLWVILLGVAMGSFPLALTLLALRTRTAHATAALSAFAQSVGYLIAGIGPLVVGILYEFTGGWDLPFVVLLIDVTVMIVAGFYAGRHAFVEDQR